MIAKEALVIHQHISNKAIAGLHACVPAIGWAIIRVDRLSIKSMVHIIVEEKHSPQHNRGI